MTHNVKIQRDLFDSRLDVPVHDTGGTTGGERDSNIRMVLAVLDTPGGVDPHKEWDLERQEAEAFWLYWTAREAPFEEINDANRSKEGRSQSSGGAEGRVRRQRRKNVPTYR